MVHLASFAVSSFAALADSVFWRPQVVINIAPTLASAPGAWLMARASGAKCWLHVQDFEVDAAMDMGIVDAGPLRRFALTCERWLMQRFDVVSTISSKMLERLATKGVAEGRCTSFPNWADIEGVRPIEGPSPYRSELGIPDDAVVALYSGNMGLKQGLELLGLAARALSGLPDMFFVFGGEGPARDALLEACAGLPNVRFLGLQPTERMRDWLGLADIHLLPQRADVADLVMPSKLTGMLASGRPVLATALPGTGVANAISDCGIATPPGDTGRFTGALRLLAGDVELRTRFGRAARARAEHDLDREHILSRIDAHLAALCGHTMTEEATV
jgi:colanic acid biosynthesis glycosyl transferase WcaI